MNRLFFIAGNNAKKQKGDMMTFFILTLLASALIFISASFLIGTGKVVDTNMKRINADKNLAPPFSVSLSFSRKAVNAVMAKTNPVMSTRPP